jgi:hypothetical protein
MRASASVSIYIWEGSGLVRSDRCCASACVRETKLSACSPQFAEIRHKRVR